MKLEVKASTHADGYGIGDWKKGKITVSLELNNLSPGWAARITAEIRKAIYEQVG